MREIGLILFAMVIVPGISHAAGLSTFLEKADPRAVSIVSIIFGIIGLGILGSIAKAVMQILNVGKYGMLVEKGCYIGAFGLFVGMITDFLGKIYN
jgi:hypothetical protein